MRGITTGSKGQKEKGCIDAEKKEQEKNNFEDISQGKKARAGESRSKKKQREN